MDYLPRIFTIHLLLAVVGLAGCKSMLPRTASVESVLPSQAMLPEFQRPFGKYLGYLRISDVSKMPIVMDVAPGISDQGHIQMRAVLSLHLGGFGSTEFASFYFPKVEEGSDGKINFGSVQEASPDLRIENARMFDGRFSALVFYPPASVGGQPRSASLEAMLYGDGEGSMDAILTLGGSAPPLAPLSGQYSAMCDGHQTALQLEYSRWNRTSSETVAGFLPDGVLTGRLGVADLASCNGDSSKCAQRVFKAGAYDPFSGRLTLQSSGGDTLCVRSGSWITCDSCTFARDISSEADAKRDLQKESIKTIKSHRRAEETIFDVGAPLDLNVLPTALAGSFYGYLHHEATNVYQPVSLSLTYAPDAGTYGAVSALYFGPVSNNEFIAYRFDALAKTKISGRVVLDGPGEAFMVLTSSGSKGLAGIWYSKTHGRIGTVSFAKGSMPPLMVEEKLLMAGLSGKYSGTYWQFDLRVAANVSENPREFYPLRMFGSAHEKGDSQRRRLIQDGTFDFYNGNVALRLDDGRTIIGRISAGGAELFWPPWPRLGPVLGGQIMQTFTRFDPSDRTIAARK